jgi:tRNA G18 (ribose-2'-O)-methylase SpoU
VIPVRDLDDERLADYRLVASPGELQRRGLFVAEGRLVVKRLVDARALRTVSILLSNTAWDALREELSMKAIEAPIYIVPQDVMNGLVGFNIHRGCLALAERPRIPSVMNVDLTPCRRVLILEGVNNPDNVGGLFRNAAAFGVDLVVLGPGCGDPFYRKAIRTAMGATLSVPMADAHAWPDSVTHLAGAGIRVLALTPAGDAQPLRSVDASTSRVALLLGAEGEGLSHAAQSAANARVRIEMTSTIDSLNVATAAAIALHYFHTR